MPPRPEMTNTTAASTATGIVAAVSAYTSAKTLVSSRASRWSRSNSVRKSPLVGVVSPAIIVEPPAPPALAVTTGRGGACVAGRVGPTGSYPAPGSRAGRAVGSGARDTGAGTDSAGGGPATDSPPLHRIWTVGAAGAAVGWLGVPQVGQKRAPSRRSSPQV